VAADDGSTCRYGLAEWAQAGPSTGLYLAAFEDEVCVDPEGNRRMSVEAAITAETLREMGC
jgi:hypothetical protein